MRSKSFLRVIQLAVLVHILTFIAPTFNDKFTPGQEVAFTCCLAFFVLEMLLKLNIWGPISFVRQSVANRFDLAIVVLALACTRPPTRMAGSGCSSGGRSSSSAC